MKVIELVIPRGVLPRGCLLGALTLLCQVTQ